MIYRELSRSCEKFVVTELLKLRGIESSAS